MERHLFFGNIFSLLHLTWNVVFFRNRMETRLDKKIYYCSPFLWTSASSALVLLLVKYFFLCLGCIRVQKFFFLVSEAISLRRNSFHSVNTKTELAWISLVFRIGTLCWQQVWQIIAGKIISFLNHVSTKQSVPLHKKKLAQEIKCNCTEFC